ncbi:MAG: type II toxin-antitoxin system VapC family toxin [Myxococcota bacterium]
MPRSKIVKPRVYIETSVLSYLTSLPSRDIIVAARQQITVEWWSTRDQFELVVSDAVLAEASQGDPDAAARRLAATAGVAVIAATESAESLAAALVEGAAMPAKAAIDAVHVALATVHGVDFLMTWNCAHIANATMRPKIEAVCRDAGFQPPVICTPEELVQEDEP